VSRRPPHTCGLHDSKRRHGLELRVAGSVSQRASRDRHFDDFKRRHGLGRGFAGSVLRRAWRAREFDDDKGRTVLLWPAALKKKNFTFMLFHK
jgi:hypothetical protein